MTRSRGPGRWWAALRARLPDTAVAAGASVPGQDRRFWASGELSGVPVTTFTTFYGASLAKQLVATLVARAALDGRVDVRGSIRQARR